MQTAMVAAGSSRETYEVALDPLERTCIAAAVGVTVVVAFVSGSAVVAAPVAFVASMVVGLAVRTPRPVDVPVETTSGAARLHEEVDRARRLDYSFALLRLERSSLGSDSDQITGAERLLASTLRATDAMVTQRDALHLVLPCQRDGGAEAARARLTETHPELASSLRRAGIAVFPIDAVTGDGLLDVCRERAVSDVSRRRAS